MLDSSAVLDEINHKLKPELSIEVLQEVASTSDYLLQNGRAKGTVCIAELQTLGRGRHANKWYSPPGTSLYLSLMWEFEAGSDLQPLSLMASMAIAAGLRKHGFTDLGVKWPNDLFIQKSKVGGLLVDTIFRGNSTIKTVIGVGINVYSQAFPEILNQSVTTLEDEYGDIQFERNKVAAIVLQSLLDIFQLGHGQWAKELKAHWDEYDIARNQLVAMTRGGIESRGLVQGINGRMQLGLSSQGKEIFYDDFNSSMRLI